MLERGSRMSRAAALALAAGVASLLLAGAAVPAWKALQALDASIDELSLRTTRYRAVIGQRQASEALLEAVRSHRPTEDHYVAGASAEHAAMALAEHVRLLAENYSGNTLTSEIGESEPMGGLDAVRVRTELTLSVAGLRRVLYRLEYGRPMLFIERLEVETQAERLREVKANPSLPIRLTVRMDIVGLRTPQTR